ncbi:MAG TPA: site-2 protease family protein [Candidatus Limnocylindria bacterium]|jgi:Zn-dependent protease/CBS domain-containing protein|nr:site-2 protease family protein [Candidatus Limnocylindria bacterium]
MGPGWRVGRIGGIDIAIHPSWLVIFFLVTFSLAESVFPREFRGWSDALYWGIGAVTAVLFFGSVLVHELSHALLARRFGLKVEGITLFIFGGATTIDSESRTPREEALIALAGPVSSFVVGGILLGIGAVVDQEQIRALTEWLGVINLLLGAFNLLPGFPMDGGRVLRALIWRVRGDRLVATRNAATVGRLFAYLLIGFGVYLALGPGNIFGGLWLALIGWFLSTAAEATAAQAGIERSLRGVRVRDAMEPEPPSVSPNETVADLVQERMLRGEDRSFLVRHDDGGLAGLVTLTDVRRLAREQWPQARVTDVMTRYADLATIAPDAPLADALRIIQEREVGQLPVVEGGDGRNPVGVVTRRGILRLIEARMKLGF